jgi:DNA-binding MarR family transcriptional regulator
MDGEKLLFDLQERKSGQLGRDFEKAFDRPLAHKRDPLTSFAAGERFVRSGQLRGQMLLVLLALRKWPNKTSAELARLAGLDRHAIARRLPNLAERGLTIRGPERMCSVCHCPCVTWRAV